MLFKIIHHLVDVNADNLLIPLPTTHTTHGHDRRFLQLSTRVNAYLNSYFPSVIKLWNSLPPDVVHQTNLTDFKSNIAVFICIIICAFMLIFEVCAVLIIIIIITSQSRVTISWEH